ncbi:MAG: HdeD family acid-resistance protein [Solirubrobacteraceae bacterium]
MLTRTGATLQLVSAIGGSAPEHTQGPIAADLSHPTQQYVRHLGTGVIVAGVLAVICGIVAVAWPKIPLLALAILIGLTLISLGALSIANAFQQDLDGGARALSGVLGLFGVIGGVVVVRRPGETLLAIILVLGLWLFGAGVVEMIRGLVYPDQRLLALLTGAIDVIIAILILSWPKESLGTLAILTGIAFIIRGLLMVYRGIQVRRLAAAS